MKFPVNEASFVQLHTVPQFLQHLRCQHKGVQRFQRRGDDILPSVVCGITDRTGRMLRLVSVDDHAAKLKHRLDEQFGKRRF